MNIAQTIMIASKVGMMMGLREIRPRCHRQASGRAREAHRLAHRGSRQAPHSAIIQGCYNVGCWSANPLARNRSSQSAAMLPDSSFAWPIARN